MLAFTLLGCDALLTEPAARGSSVEVMVDPARAGFSGRGSRLPAWGTRELWLRLNRLEASRDTVVLAELEDGVFRAAVWLHPDELTGPLDIQAQIRLPEGLAVLGGTATVEDLGMGPDIHIELTPRPLIASIDPGETRLAFSAFNGAFHTEHPIPRSTDMDLRVQDGLVVINSRYRGLQRVDPYSGEVRSVLDPDDPSLPPSVLSPKFSADGEWIYFSGRTLTGPLAHQAVLWKIRPDGSDAASVLTSGTSGNEISSLDRPAPSPDGSRLAFVWDPPGYSIGYLGILDFSTGETSLYDVAGVGPMRWSPDDQWIAYVQSRSSWEGGRLHLIRPDGTEDHVVAPDLEIGTSFDWTGDGRYIVATSPNDYAVRIDVSTGDIDILSNLGHVRQVAVAP